MQTAAKTIIWIAAAVAAFRGCDRTGAGGEGQAQPVPQPRTRPAGLQAIDRREVRFGQARIAVGMDKAEVLRQIRLSRSQYDSPADESSAEVIVPQPSDATVRSDTWTLHCPTRNTHFLGGGSAIIPKLRFREGKLVAIRQLPYLAG